MQQIDDFKNRVQAEINSAQGPESIKKQIVGGRFQELADIMQELFGLIPTLGAGEALPTTDPGDKPVGTWYNAFTSGTYTHFDGITINEPWVVLSKNDDGSWTKGVVNISLSSYLPKASVQDNLNSLSIDSPLAANQGRVLAAKIGAIATTGYAYTQVGESYSGTASFFNETSTFSGYGFLMPAQAAFNSIRLHLRSWDAANLIQNIRVLIRDGGSGGTILGDKTLQVSAPQGIGVPVEVLFGEEINSGNNLWVVCLTDGHCGVYGTPGGPNTDTKYTTAQDLITEPSQGSGLSHFAYIEFLQGTQSADPLPEFSDKVIESSPQLNEKFVKVDSSIVMQPGEGTPVESFSISNADYRTAPNINGWGSPIGSPTNFNKVGFKLRGASGNIVDITSVRCWVTVFDRGGAVLTDKTISGLSISAGETAEIEVIFDSVIWNANVDEIFFVFAADQEVDQFGTDSGNVYDSPPYGHSVYTTNKSISTLNPSSFAGAGGGQRNVWVETSYAGEVPVPTDLFAAEIEKKISGASKTLSDFIAAEIVLPSRIYAVEGLQLNIYFKNIIHSNFPIEGLQVDVSCNKGKQYADYYRYTPVASDAGTTAFNISVLHNNIVIASASATLYTASISAGSGVSRSLIAVGDSTTDGGEYLRPTAVDHAGDIMSVTFKGTMGSDPVKTEGRGGYTVNDYSTEGRQLYRFDVTGVDTAPGIDSNYNDGAGSVYKIREVNITGGAGYVAGQIMSGPGSPTATGTLTKESGAGDATVSYTATSFTSGNPFWNGTALDFAGYLSTNSIALSSGDWVTFHLGINDVFNEPDDTGVEVKSDTMITQLRALIANMRAAVSGLRIGLCITIPPSGSQDAFGTNYSNGRTMARYRRNNKIWCQKMIEEFDNDTERTAGNYLIPFHASIDRLHNFPKSTENANSRSTDQVEVWTNGVHPAQGGYYQMGDVLFAFLKNMI